MNHAQFIRAVTEAGGASDTSALVVFQNKDSGEIFSVEEVFYEPQSSDEGGNPTSTGATVFIRGTAS